jgi:hypothetical protein
MPLSDEALQFARRLAAAKYRYPDDRLAVADLLQRWSLGLGTTLAERRMALRISRDQAVLNLPTDTDTDSVAALPSVRRVLDAPESNEPAPRDLQVEVGDDDADDEIAREANADFYADALEDA